ncbi:indolepyruvate oxidoreductase subunit beta [Ideonella alba]|uniref:Indolepyruvate oxidoreductase subunit beta n=1 Tax=Ideonella alba TaxID=2824118 RepID=A0A940Y7K8_9BURK|nr:indolepyruvate oxidoreductase subunit beta [Ideonella alba]MBQ0930141.1 indolepyruvate oxidoreductase subunit beta [Ideonella alba]
MTLDLVLGGVGGQGVLSIAWVIDQAAHAAGLHIKQSEVHGMAQRGGAVSACVRLSDQPVASDLIAAGSAALVAAVEPLEALRYTPLLRTDGTVVTDVTPLVNIDHYPDLETMLTVLFSLPNLVAVDATRLAHAAGTVKAQNTVVLGAAAPLLPLPREALEAQLQTLFEPKGERIVQANLRAFRKGAAATGFVQAMRAAGVPSARVARVSSRLAFAPHPVDDTLLAAWAERLLGPHGEATARQVWAAPKLLPLEAVHAVTA